MYQYSIGVDLGGQSLKIGLVDNTGTLHLRYQVDVDPAQSADHIARMLVEQINHFQNKARKVKKSPATVGVVMPGYMDPQRTRLLFAANLPTLNGSDFLATIKKAVDLPVTFDADCNAAAWAEFRFGAGQDTNRLIVATIGTGIGAGVIIEGQILRIFNHTAGSLGHTIIDPQGQKCNCGATGCLETRASGLALEKSATKLAQQQPTSQLAKLLTENVRLTGRQIAIALKQNDSPAQQAVNQCGWWLGAGIASWCAIYNPQKVLIAGGLALLGESLLTAIRNGLKDVGQPNLTESLTVELAALGADAGIIGAADLAIQL